MEVTIISISENWTFLWDVAIPAAQVHLLIPQLLHLCPHNKHEAARCSSISTEYKRNLVKNEDVDHDMRTIRLGEKGRDPNSSQIFLSDSLDTNSVEWSGHREEEYSLLCGSGQRTQTFSARWKLKVKRLSGSWIYLRSFMPQDIKWKVFSLRRYGLHHE